MTATAVSVRYFNELPRLKAVLRLCKKSLQEAASSIDPAAVVSGRVKTHRSVLGKVYRKAGAPRPWESLGDLVALKAVFPTERGVRAFTEWVLAQESLHPTLDSKPSLPNELKYHSQQFDLVCDELTDTTGRPQKFELQIRTAAGDAWYIVDHRLRYKGTVELPDVLKRKLFRLIVLTELFDEEVEAVLDSQASLPEYAVARLYESLADVVDDATGGYSKTSRPEGLLELLLSSYQDTEIATLEADVTKFISERRPLLKAVLSGHLHDSADFVEERDWLYYEPEALLIAERASNRPALLAAAIAGSDFESVIVPMAREFQAAAGK